jgi:hypothetical protein
VSRTAAPVTMITANATNAPMLIWRYRCGEIVGRIDMVRSAYGSGGQGRTS